MKKQQRPLPSEKEFHHLIELLKKSKENDLLEEIVNTSFKLLEDGTERGDLKIINSALKELRYSFKVFSPYRRVRKASIFGSARTEEQAPEYQMAKEFSHLLCESGWMVITGAASGIMKAGHEGAGREKSFGVNIRLPFEQKANTFIENDPKLINFKYFFTRKLIFVKESDAIVLFPGGFGTHDEGFEALTLIQTGKSTPRPIVMVAPKGNDYWEDWKAFIEKHLLKTNLISPDDMGLFRIFYNIQDAVKEVVGFYKIFHSSRFVADQLVLRLTQAIPDSAVSTLNQEFKDLIAEGKIEKGNATEDEANEPDLATFPRLIFHFNRQHWGRLRQMIDFINTL
ncbi:MAG: LOG family protein [Chlamydiae bacterium]|nr:LOG family protein [Chlamydiota bacterium]MBI3276536.1 LOG family protein [Chlamydiota bacterium]